MNFIVKIVNKYWKNVNMVQFRKYSDQPIYTLKIIKN